MVNYWYNLEDFFVIIPVRSWLDMIFLILVFVDLAIDQYMATKQLNVNSKACNIDVVY